MINQKQNLTKEDDEIIALGATILFIFLKMGIFVFLIYVVLKIVSIINP
jgi:hypothetical protein